MKFGLFIKVVVYSYNNQYKLPPPNTLLMNSTYNVVISGRSASGKTTVSNVLKEILSKDGARVDIIRQDWYYHDLPARGMSIEDRRSLELGISAAAAAKYGFDTKGEPFSYDHPAIFDFAALREDLGKVRAGEAIERPAYDFPTHAPHKEDTVGVRDNLDFLIVEGTTVNNPDVYQVPANYRIHMSTPHAICNARRLKRDVEERERTPESVEAQRIATVEPMAVRYIDPTTNRATHDSIHLVDWSQPGLPEPLERITLLTALSILHAASIYHRATHRNLPSFSLAQISSFPLVSTSRSSN